MSSLNMGLGYLGQGTFRTPSHKIRYTLAGDFPAGKIEEAFVKYEKKIDDNSFITTFFDVNNIKMTQVYTIFQAFYEPNLGTIIPPAEFAKQKGTVTMKQYDGVGTLQKIHIFRGVWPQAINFGDLDYSSSEECNIEVTWRYDTHEEGQPQ